MLVEEFLMDVVLNVAIFALAAAVIGRALALMSGRAYWQQHLALGVVLGVTAAACMQLPFEVMPGVVFDGRATAVAAAGLFGGPIGALVAIWPPGVFRVWLGGDGVAPGLVNLVLSGGLGCLVRCWAMRDMGRIRMPHVFATAMLMPLAVVLAFPFLPSLDLAWTVFKKMGPTLAIAGPVGFAILGYFIWDQKNRIDLNVELAEKQSLVNAVHADVPAMLWQRRVGVDGRPKFTYVSDSSRRILDLEPAEIYADPSVMVDVVHPDDREAFLARITAGEKVGRLEPAHFRVVAKNGDTRWVRSTAVAVRRNDGLIWNGVTTDVTDAVVAEERVSALAQIVEDLNLPIARTDPDLNVVFFNRAASELYGYDQEDVLGAPAAIFRPPEKVEFMASFLAERRRNLTAGAVQTEGLHKSGERIPLRLEMTPLFCGDGALNGWAFVSVDLREQISARKELERLATTDPLTGLANRRTFESCAAGEIARARRHKRPLAVVMADIDHFKRVNDVHGHAGGDEALRAIAGILTNSLRGGGDLAARLGGEEFVLLLPECDADSASRLAERLRTTIAASETSSGADVITLTSSFGVSEWLPAEKDFEPAMKRADKALYRAKSNGRNRVEVEEVRLRAVGSEDDVANMSAGD